ncbi:hypothetical protein GCM10023221_01890 [Luteimicrobium xylanilyticum]
MLGPHRGTSAPGPGRRPQARRSDGVAPGCATDAPGVVLSSEVKDGYGRDVTDVTRTVEVRRSRRRVSTVSAYRDGERTIVAIPARFSRAQEREWVERMLARLEEKEQRRRPSDEQLLQRATELSERYLDGRAHPSSVRWSSNQGRRWGSCTLLDGSIRISDRVQGMPGWVLDYVLLHELAHLLHAGHGPEFWELLEAYPRTERARGYLEGVTFGKTS